MSAPKFSIQPVSSEPRKTKVVAGSPRASFNARGMIAAFATTFVLAGTMLSQQTEPVTGDMLADAARNGPGAAVAQESLPYVYGEPMALLPKVDVPQNNVRRMIHGNVPKKGVFTQKDETSSASVKQASSQKGRRPHLVLDSEADEGTIAAIRQQRLQQAKSSGVAIPKHAAPIIPAVAVNPYNKYGVYLTASSAASDKFLNETMDDLLASGGSTFVIDVKGYFVYFSSDAPMAKEIGMVSPTIDLPAILQKAHDRGIYTIARYIAVKDEGLVERKPGWQLKHKDKNYVVNPGWIDPANEEALQYNREILCELAAIPNLDEINLDYIRMSSTMPYSTGYTGDEKAERLMHYIRMARETIDACGPQVKLGVSTYAILGWNFPANRETIGQDVQQYAPYVDVISPMAYPATFTSGGYYNPAKHPGSRMYWLVYRTLIGYAEVLGPEHSHKLRPWIQAYGVDQKNVTDQMNAVVDAGYCGFTWWNANNNFGPVYAAMKNWKQPERCQSQTVSEAEPKYGKLGS